MSLLSRFRPAVSIADLEDPVKNPDVRPAGLIEWSGVWLFALYCIEEAIRRLEVWPDAPWWVGFPLLALPLIARWIRERMTRKPATFRRVA